MRHLCEALFFGLSFMVAVRRAPLGAPGFLVCRSTNLRAAATPSFILVSGLNLKVYARLKHVRLS